MRLAMQNLKKQKSQYISFGIMLCITAFIVNIALVLAAQTSKAYDNRFEELNTADLNIIIPNAQDYNELLDDLENIDGVDLAEKHEGVFATATVSDFAESDFDMNTVFYNMDDKRTLNMFETDGKVKSGSKIIYVPEYMIKMGGFSVGDDITYSIGDSDFTFNIEGTVAEMQYGNYGTGLIGAYMPKKAYDIFADDNNSKLISEYSIKIDSGAEINKIKNDITSLISDKNISLININDHNTAKQTRIMISNLLITIFIAIAFIIFLINIFLSSFRIRNNIENEITNMGVLKAIGYTSMNIILSEVIPYTLVGLITTVIGALISYTAIPSVANFLATQSGFSFSPTFDVYAILATTIIPTLFTLLCTYFCARKIRKLEPIYAIRGINQSGTNKNHFPIKNSKIGVKPTLILKQIVASPGQNILLFILSFGIMILLSFAGTLIYNVNIEPENFLNTISEETPSVIFTANDANSLDELKTTLQDDKNVNKVFEYSSKPVSYEDGSITCIVCEDFSLVKNNICYEGRNPEENDEIAIGSALADKYDIGNKIKIENGKEHKSYTITGFIQSINNNGLVCELTNDGYKEISELAPTTLNVYISGKSAEKFIDEYENDFPDLITSSVNYEKLTENVSNMYASVVSGVTVAIFLISVLVILLVMYILINSMITAHRQEFGIYKALGWSNKQLVIQTTFSFIPIIAISSIISAFVGLSIVPALNNSIWESLGAMQNHFEVSIYILLTFALILVLISFIISIILSRPIKRISAYTLFTE